MEDLIYTMVLSDGTIIENLRKNGDNYISASKLTADMFEEVIGPVGVDETLVNSESKQAPKAPGMKYRHYAPKAKMMIVEGNIREEILAIRQLAYAAHREGKEVGIIATGETVQFYNYGIVKNIGTRENENTIARNLYRVLREFDEEDVDLIYSESFAMNGIGKAIMNRLEKAAGHMHLQATDHKEAEVSQSDFCQRGGFGSRTNGGRITMSPGS